MWKARHTAHTQLTLCASDVEGLGGITNMVFMFGTRAKCIYNWTTNHFASNHIHLIAFLCHPSCLCSLLSFCMLYFHPSVFSLLPSRYIFITFCLYLLLLSILICISSFLYHNNSSNSIFLLSISIFFFLSLYFFFLSLYFFFPSLYFFVLSLYFFFLSLYFLFLSLYFFVLSIYFFFLSPYFFFLSLYFFLLSLYFFFRSLNFFFLSLYFHFFLPLSSQSFYLYITSSCTSF